MWRLTYYGALGAMALFATATGYRPGVMLLILKITTLWACAVFGAKVVLWLLLSRPEHPVAYARANAARISLDTMDRLGLFYSAAFFFAFLAPLKMLIPKPNGFFADEFLAAWDRALFGRDPWELLHELPLTPILDPLYSLWAATILAAVMIIAATADEEKLRRFFLCWAIAFWLLGFFLAMALASAGPIFGPNLGFGFEPLAERLASGGADYTLRISASLWNAYVHQGRMIGAGISAAPSMHCALTFLVVLAARGSWAVAPAAVYAAVIWFGSVYLGWHYFVDGLISLAAIGVLWRVVASRGLLAASARPGGGPRWTPARVQVSATPSGGHE